MLTMIVVPNTSPDQIAANVKANAAQPYEWLVCKGATDKPAILVGGGPSAADHLDDIRKMKDAGGVVFAMNGSSRWLRKHGIVPDWQLIADAKEETASLVDTEAKGHLFSSAVNPGTMAKVANPVVWHPVFEGIAELFPEPRRKAEYTIVGGTSAGTHALCAAYALGHRELHCFGYDSSHRGMESHTYSQPMNQGIPNVEVEWAGKTYLCSVAMKDQAERFPVTARELLSLGCKLTVHGDGLLPAIWSTPPEKRSEKDKYRLMWQFNAYRAVAPGERLVDLFLEMAKPDGRIIDFGAGTGRAALKMAQKGCDVLLIDFADNCRDHEAIALPFLEWDLSKPCPIKAPYGFCTDVMEHIPPHQVDTVLANIFGSADRVFFQISLVDDACGALIGQPLHLSVHPFGWWLEKLQQHGQVSWSFDGRESAMFYVKKKEH